MLLTKEKFNERLNSEGNLLPKDSREEDNVTIVKWGGNSTKERVHYKLTDEQRIEIGSLGRIFPTKDVAELTGVSQDAVRDLRNGKVGSSGFNAELMKEIDARTESVKKATHDVALDKLLKTLEFITEDKMENSNARQLSSIASNLSKVASNLTPKVESNGNGKGVTIVLFQPQPAKETHFEVIDV